MNNNAKTSEIYPFHVECIDLTEDSENESEIDVPLRFGTEDDAIFQQADNAPLVPDYKSYDNRHADLGNRDKVLDQSQANNVLLVYNNNNQVMTNATSKTLAKTIPTNYNNNKVRVIKDASKIVQLQQSYALQAQENLNVTASSSGVLQQFPSNVTTHSEKSVQTIALSGQQVQLCSSAAPNNTNSRKLQPSVTTTEQQKIRVINIENLQSRPSASNSSAKEQIAGCSRSVLIGAAPLESTCGGQPPPNPADDPVNITKSLKPTYKTDSAPRCATQPLNDLSLYKKGFTKMECHKSSCLNEIKQIMTHEQNKIDNFQKNLTEPVKDETKEGEIAVESDLLEDFERFANDVACEKTIPTLNDVVINVNEQVLECKEHQADLRTSEGLQLIKKGLLLVKSGTGQKLAIASRKRMLNGLRAELNSENELGCDEITPPEEVLPPKIINVSKRRQRGKGRRGRDRKC